MEDQALENKSYIHLPEGVEIALTPVGLVARSYAYMIDFAIRAIIITLLSLFFGLLGAVGEGLALITFFVVSWGYNIYFEARSGQTPGKKRLNIRVVQDNGLPASFSQIVVRNLLRPADMLPFGYFFGLLVMAFNERFKRIGDWAAGTIIVYDEAFLERPILPSGISEVPTLVFTTQEQLAILTYAERSNTLSSERRIELAAILSQVMNCDNNQSEIKLLNYARYFSGHVTNNSAESHDKASV
ncbi:RDD family protein [Pseudoalteromonas sp. TB64]|uniref:RDD family protein n=1 Tax=Pseudoalteromonas sp. TB64 TaxID=1938600 RepID=UPI00041A8A5B|nr:RDD family protein [Pseudoalteromonas sp. TB64]